VERSDGAQRPRRVIPSRGDGLATVTYLPGALAAHTRPSDAQPTDTPSDRSASQLSEPQVFEPGTPEPGTPEPDAPESDVRAAQRAERISMNALTRRGMSKREVERSLLARELDDETVAAELDRLEGVGLIDDMALAQNLVGILQERKGLGRSSIAAELTRRLLAPAAIEYALELIETSDELGRARDLAVKRASQLRSYDRETAVRRLSGFLMRRGYSGSTVRAAVEHALPATPSSRVTFR